MNKDISKHSRYVVVWWKHFDYAGLQNIAKGRGISLDKLVDARANSDSPHSIDCKTLKDAEEYFDMLTVGKEMYNDCRCKFIFDNASGKVKTKDSV